MSDNWDFYPCQMGENTAFVFYDHGLCETIDELSQSELIKAWLTIKETNKAGLPVGDSFDVLSAFEDDLTKAVETANAVYVGRVTVAGSRVFYCYGASGEESLQPVLQTIADRFGFEIKFEAQFDPDKENYWEILYPSDDDKRVMDDMKVLDALAKHGDDGTAERLVEHWAYFPDEDAANAFRAWLQEEGYALATEESGEDTADKVANEDEVNESEEKVEVCVRFSHEGPVTLSDITSHTVKLQQQAVEIQGNYDGWETMVCKQEANE